MYITHTHSLHHTPRMRLRAQTSSAKIGPVTRSVIVLALIAVAVLYYVLHMTFIATAGYTESTLKTQIDTLNKEKQTLELEAAEAQSLHQVSAQKLNLVPINQVQYIQRVSEVASR